MKNLVAQKHSMSCGVASVANIVGCSYEDAMAHFDISHASTRGYYCMNLVAALKEFNKSYRFKKLTDKDYETLNHNGSIVFVAKSENLPYGHWLARIDDMWADPWINLSVDSDVQHAQAGFRQELPGRPEWLVYRLEP